MLISDLLSGLFLFSRLRRLLYSLRNIFNLKDLCHLLFAPTMMDRCRPLVIKLLPSLTVLFLLVSFSNKRMLQQLRPRKSLTWGLVQ